MRHSRLQPFPALSVERTLAAQSLLAAIAERGADAVGYAYRSPGDDVPDGGQAADAGVAAARARRGPGRGDQLLVHVRDYTKGHPSIAANNHPVRHGPVVGIHNGIIVNDDELLAEPRLRARRAADDRRLGGDLRARGALAQRPARARGAARARWPRRGSTSASRSCSSRRAASGRPLWLGEGRDGVFFASTKLALEIVERYCGLRLRKRELREGTLRRAPCRQGRAPRALPRRSAFVEDDPLPAVRAPEEREVCLTPASRR